MNGYEDDFARLDQDAQRIQGEEADGIHRVRGEDEDCSYNSLGEDM